MKAFQVALLFILSICIAFLSVGNVSAQSTVKTYNNPLAYVGTDGNIYVTSLDGTGTTAITSDMAFDPGYYGAVPPIYGSIPHWSPQGLQIAFSNEDSLYRVESGKLPAVLISNVKNGIGVFAWSPDGTEVAHIPGSAHIPFSLVDTGVQIVQSNGTPVRIVTPFLNGCGGVGLGNGPGPERVWRTVGEERDQNEIDHSSVPLNWTSLGFLLDNPACDGGISLVSSKGTVVWESSEFFDILVSPTDTHIVASRYVTDAQGALIDDGPGYLMQPIMIDLATGDKLPLHIRTDAEPLAWTNDSKSIIFSTKKLYKKIKAVEKDNPTLFDEQDHFDYILTLWRQGLDEKYPTKLFQHEGYDFGRVTVAPDDSAVAFSLISNSAFDKVDLEVQIVAVPMNGGSPQWIAIGGKPAFGKGPFTAIPAADSTSLSNPIGCPKAFVGRLNVGQRAKVVSGYVSNLQTRPIDGAIVTVIPSDSIFLVLDGPQCAADGRVWWKGNYQGTVGWTAEGDGKNYWLEP